MRARLPCTVHRLVGDIPPGADDMSIVQGAILRRHTARHVFRALVLQKRRLVILEQELNPAPGSCRYRQRIREPGHGTFATGRGEYGTNRPRHTHRGQASREHSQRVGARPSSREPGFAIIQCRRVDLTSFQSSGRTASPKRKHSEHRFQRLRQFASIHWRDEHQCPSRWKHVREQLFFVVDGSFRHLTRERFAP